MFNTQAIKQASIWSILETLINTSLSIVTIVFLARILIPEDYGKIATAQFITGFLQIILTLGINDAIIQKRKLENIHIQTLWTVTIILAIVGLILSLIISFLFFYNDNRIISKIMLFEGGNLMIAILSVVPTALLMRNLDLKKYVLRSIFSKIIFLIVSIYLVFNGFGLWSVVYGLFIQNIIGIILLYNIANNIIPKKIQLDFKVLKDVINFSFFVMVENLLWSVLNRVLGLIISIIHGTTVLGLYHMSTRLIDTILNILNAGITRITLPIFSQVQNNREKLLYAFQAATYYFNLISIPLFFMITITAKQWVPIFLGHKWLDIIPIIQIISIMYALMYTRIFVGTTVKAIGKSKDFLYLSIFSASIILLVTYFTRFNSIENMLFWIAFLRVTLTIPAGIYLMHKICKFEIKEQIKPISIPITFGMILIIIMKLISENLYFNDIINLTIMCVVFIFLCASYIILLYKFKRLKWIEK